MAFLFSHTMVCNYVLVVKYFFNPDITLDNRSAISSALDNSSSVM